MKAVQVPVPAQIWQIYGSGCKLKKKNIKYVPGCVDSHVKMLPSCALKVPHYATKECLMLHQQVISRFSA